MLREQEDIRAQEELDYEAECREKHKKLPYWCDSGNKKRKYRRSNNY